LPGRPINDQILPRVLIWALLLCHGVFGALHVATDPALTNAAPAALIAGEHTAAHLASGHHGGSGYGDHQADHGATEYFAVLLGAFASLTLWFLLRRAPRRAATSYATRRSVGAHPAVFALPRGPTLPSLQVFRL
jgi:hypothetical protein